ncbi:hypothetical protein [Bacillus toyonensis]|uniref:hypothetical protein n=1 Tax=Bacillus toyonensis TaxID=155322 RepID=UPI000BFCDB1A|nr:hypothetical protein [Bacillus toyonensis]PHC10128.1 hypothetical protein COF03_28890 [Bacillus toyonensis]PHD96602.1 hypothetical protein COF43_22355 [Bacillus toyonensis]
MYYNYALYYFPFEMDRYISSQPVNFDYRYPSYFDGNFDYNISNYKRDYSVLNKNDIVTLQNNTDEHWKNWYLDLDYGKLILATIPENGSRWRLNNHGNNIVSLQNNANTHWKNWFLDINSYSGEVVLRDRLYDGGYWKLTDQGNGLVNLQSTANTPWKDWYLDINGPTREIILRKNLNSGGYWIIKEVKDLKQYPIRGFEYTELNDHRRMETIVTIGINNRMDVMTNTWTSEEFQGFQGYAMVVLLDGPQPKGNAVYVTKLLRYWVNPKSHRDDNWFVYIPQDILEKVTHYAIIHADTPLPILTPENFKEWSDIVFPFVKEFTQESCALVRTIK